MRGFLIYSDIDNAEEILNSVNLKLCVPLLCFQYLSTSFFSCLSNE
jgi:hypothetical protein